MKILTGLIIQEAKLLQYIMKKKNALEFFRLVW